MTRRVLTVLAHTLLRGAALVGVYLVFVHWVHLEGDDGLGTGLLAFTAFGALALVWGFVDGWFLGFRTLTIAWLGAATLTCVAMSPLAQGGDEPVDWGLALTDLVTFWPFVLTIVAAPALVAAAVAATIRPPRPALPR